MTNGKVNIWCFMFIVNSKVLESVIVYHWFGCILCDPLIGPSEYVTLGL